MTRVLVHNPYWDTMGGGERYTATFVKLMLDLGHEVHIDFSNVSDKIKDRFGIDISAAKWDSGPKPDILFWVSDGSLPTSFAKKTIIHFQFPFQNVGGKNIKNFLKSRVFKFVVNSKFTKQYIDREFGVNSVVVYPPVDIASFQPGVKQNFILYLARFSQLTQKKGHAELIKIFAETSSKLKGWKLVLAGSTDVGVDDRYLENLKELSSGLPIKIITNPSFTDIKNLYSISKIFCSPSGLGADSPLHVEHFGITVVEAMSAGCVPVITKLGGHQEIIEDGKSGYLWDSQEQLQSLLVDLTKRDLSALSQAAIQRSKMFSEDVFHQSFKRLI